MRQLYRALRRPSGLHPRANTKATLGFLHLRRTLRHIAGEENPEKSHADAKSRENFKRLKNCNSPTTRMRCRLLTQV
jgi:hypothetical protein